MTIKSLSGSKPQFNRTLSTVTLGLILSIGAFSAQARNLNPSHLRNDAPQVYVVKKGDTLWGIAGRFLKSPWRWPEIWASNQHVKNPHWIYPGDRLLLCSTGGQPLIGKDEGDGCAGIIRRAGVTTLAPQIRVESIANALPVIPLDEIRVWLERSLIVAPDTSKDIPYVVGMPEQHVIAGKGNLIYVRGKGLQVGQRYAVYRLGEPYQASDTKGKLQDVALELTQVAGGQAIQQQPDMTTIEINKSYGSEIRMGDLIMPEYDAMLPTLFYPVPAQQVRGNGRVIRVLGSISSAGKHSSITLDRGALDGVALGQVFAIDQSGEIVNDPKTGKKFQLPHQRIGHALVFKTFDHYSYAYVTDSTLQIKLGAELAVPLSDE